MVEYAMLTASAAKQVIGSWMAKVNVEVAVVGGALLLLVWLVYRAFVVRR
ncbi:MAG TPA: hypothetical protein VFN83_06510 [Gemmatimonadales bacterium]|jgi:hypothetical protein|nr:hypothetical protein [Gemmatimonadales bacterium]